MSGYMVPDVPAGPVEIKEKGSRFIAYLYPIKTPNDAENILKSLKKEHYNATHVCFAWRVGNGEEKQFRYSDDGEPNGTAGIPIYHALQGSGLFNVLIASVRYFGGTKLGTGGLIRAYSASAKSVLLIVRHRLVIPKTVCLLDVPFALISTVTHLIENEKDSEILSREYHANGVLIKAALPNESLTRFSELVTEATASRVVVSSDGNN